MGYLKRNWRELLVGGIFILAVIGLAIATPYLFPAFFAAALPILATGAVAGSGTFATIFATGLFYGISVLAAMVTGVIGAGFTSLIGKCFSSPSAQEHTHERQPRRSRTFDYRDPETYAGPAQIATNFMPPQHGQPYAAAPTDNQLYLHTTRDPIQTVRGYETEAYLKTMSGEIRGVATLDPQTGETTSVRYLPGAEVAEKKSTDLQPFYMQTNKR